MNKRLSFIIDALKKEYPDAVCSLEYEQPHELLFSTRLSAQCTDARVNIVAKDLYARYRTLEDFANADLEELESHIAAEDAHMLPVYRRIIAKYARV